MSRKKEPDNVKQLRGTDQPCRSSGSNVDFEAIQATPPAPQYLEIEAKTYWDRIVPILINKRVLSIADLEALEIMCVLYGRIRKMSAAGVDINSSLVTQLRLYQVEFGLTPAARSKVGGQGEKPKANSFSNNGRKNRGS